MDASFILTKLALEELKSLGYTEIWLGRVSNPHWKHGMSNMVLASPALRTSGIWPRLWGVSNRNFGEIGCGNSFIGADAAQFELVRKMMAGHYRLVEGCWEPVEPR